MKKLIAFCLAAVAVTTISCKKDTPATTPTADIVAGVYKGYAKFNIVCPIGPMDSMSVYSDNMTAALKKLNSDYITCSVSDPAKAIYVDAVNVFKENNTLVFLYKGDCETGRWEDGKLLLYPGCLVFCSGEMPPVFSAANVYDCKLSQGGAPSADGQKLVVQVPKADSFDLIFGESKTVYASISGVAYDSGTGTLSAESASGRFRLSESESAVVSNTKVKGNFNLDTKTFTVDALFTPVDGVSPAVSYRLTGE